MNHNEILCLRLQQQQLTKHSFKSPAEVVSWMCALQAQDYTQAKWALGSRLAQATEKSVEDAFADRSIVRTWLMRGTLHTAAAKDVHWLLELLGPKILAASASRHKQLELDAATFKKAFSVLSKELRDGAEQTREELSAAFAKVNVDAKGMRLVHILHKAAVEKIICLGVRNGKQFTYTLLDNWVKNETHYSREEALTVLAQKYFMSRGPATVADLAWWAGLSLTDARAGLEQCKAALHKEITNGQEYWMAPLTAKIKVPSGPLLLSGFDEYVLGYKDRSLIVEEIHSKKIMTVNGIFYPVIVEEGRITGNWKRIVKKDFVEIESAFFEKAKTSDIRLSAKKYAAFEEKKLKGIN